MKSNPLNYTIRKAVLNDLHFFYEAVKLQSNLIVEVDKFNEQFKKKLKDKEAMLLVLEVAQQSVGFITAQLYQSLTDAYPFYEIQELYISPKYRKLKAADFIYTALEQKIASKSIYKLKVNCNINSTLNQNFYINKGFKIYKKQYTKGL